MTKGEGIVVSVALTVVSIPFAFGLGWAIGDQAFDLLRWSGLPDDLAGVAGITVGVASAISLMIAALLNLVMVISEGKTLFGHRLGSTSGGA